MNKANLKKCQNVKAARSGSINHASQYLINFLKVIDHLASKLLSI